MGGKFAKFQTTAMNTHAAYHAPCAVETPLTETSLRLSPDI